MKPTKDANREGNIVSLAGHKKEKLHFHRLELYAKNPGSQESRFCTLESLGTDIV